MVAGMEIKKICASYRNIQGIYLVLSKVTFLIFSQLGLKMHLTKNQVFLVVTFLCATVCCYVQCGKCETKCSVTSIQKKCERNYYYYYYYYYYNCYY